MKILKILLIAILGMSIIACEDDDDDMMNPGPTGEEMVYNLDSRDVQGMSGTATFVKNDDQSTTITLELQGAIDGESYPAHIHENTAIEGGGIAVSLEPVEGSTGRSEITISELDNGQSITYEELLQFDGYINIHKSADDLATIVAQGDIGQNMLTGEFRLYQLGEKDVDGVNGSARFEERLNGEALATLELNNSTRTEDSPAHIHMNTAAEGGSILFTFNPVDSDTDRSMTNVATLDDNTSFGYDDVLNVDGYINVHQSANDLATLLAQADIGQNELTGQSKVYVLAEKDVPGIEGTATFMERLNGEALAILDIENTPQDGEHPAHIHMNTAVEGGGIAVSFNPVIGATGMSQTNIAATDDGNALGYDQILDFDGYINVHLSADELATIVAQGDIGQNELTGESTSYTLSEKDLPGYSGEVTFMQRLNGEALAMISVSNTIAGTVLPAHIHAGSVAEAPGDIVVSFNPVDGDTGISATNLTSVDSGDDLSYSDILDIDGYVNVHLSASELGVIVAQGNIGAND